MVEFRYPREYNGVQVPVELFDYDYVVILDTGSGILAIGSSLILSADVDQEWYSAAFYEGSWIWPLIPSPGPTNPTYLLTNGTLLSTCKGY
ncbi:hypothetical protein FACS189437_00400 [Bacteroidia bacterium]|nr:hypothetical protein FACS189437_00400 [Bacteroidia bacterium]